MIQAKAVCDSITQGESRLTTLQVTMPKVLLAQLNTHRRFSRNAASSRAIPVSKVIERIRQSPVVPTHWGKNKPGMVASEEVTDSDLIAAQCEWYSAISCAVSSAYRLNQVGVHKQIANRLLEPFMYVDVVTTATEWRNFFHLRLDDSTQPEMQEVARKMHEAIANSVPQHLEPGEWHLPYVDQGHELVSDPNELIKYSVARCARVSYLNHDNSDPDPKKDLELYDRLLNDGHMSPFEHQATPMRSIYTKEWENGVTHMDRDMVLWSGNFKGWIQNRQLL